MIFKIEPTTSGIYTKSHLEKYVPELEKLGFKINKKGWIEFKEITIEINTVKELMELTERFSKLGAELIIIWPDTIEIYNDYRE